MHKGIKECQSSKMELEQTREKKEVALSLQETAIKLFEHKSEGKAVQQMMPKILLAKDRKEPIKGRRGEVVTRPLDKGKFCLMNNSSAMIMGGDES